MPIEIFPRELAVAWELVRELGSGSFGAVLEVIEKKTGKHMAVKRMKFGTSDEKTMAMNEIKIAASFEHPNLVGIKTHHVDAVNRRIFVFMELCRDKTLLSRVIDHATAGTRFEEDEIWSVALQTLRGLDQLHHPPSRPIPAPINATSKVVIHKDLKCENLLFDGLVVKIADFGLSRILNHGVVARTFGGTRGYMSPEMSLGREYTVSTDVWSLGIIIFSMATLEMPFPLADTKDDFLPKSYRPPSIKGRYRHSMQQLIDSMLQKRPEDRPTTQTLLGAYELILIGRGVDVAVKSAQLAHGQRKLLEDRQELARQREAQEAWLAREKARVEADARKQTEAYEKAMAEVVAERKRAERLLLEIGRGMMTVSINEQPNTRKRREFDFDGVEAEPDAVLKRTRPNPQTAPPHPPPAPVAPQLQVAPMRDVGLIRDLARVFWRHLV